MKIVVAGIGTDVGKTVVSAIITHILNASYWKVIQTGGSDAKQVRFLNPQAKILPESYHFKAALSPHHAARLEGKEIDVSTLDNPQGPLVIEGIGGVMTPLNDQTLFCDLFNDPEFHWILVSRHYLGSLNHTLLTLQEMQRRKLNVAGIIFNGTPYPEGESYILNYCRVPFIGRLQPELKLTPTIIRGYAKKWKPLLSKIS